MTYAASLVFLVSCLASHSSLFLHRFCSKIGLHHSEQLSKSALLGYALAILLPSALQDLSWQICCAVLASSVLIFYTFEALFSLLCNASRFSFTQNPWVYYALLLPHCFLEGISMNAISLQKNLVLFIAFLAHKTSEIALVTLSTQTHIASKRTQRLIQIAFISLTPLAMAITQYTKQQTLFTNFFHANHAVFDLLSATAIIHLALFCRLCSCKHQPSAKSNNTTFIVALILFSCVFYTLEPACEHHHSMIHTHSHHR